MLVNNIFDQTEIGGIPTKRYGTRMTRIGRIFTDIFNPCVSGSSARKAMQQESLRPLRSLRLNVFPPRRLSTRRLRLPFICGRAARGMRMEGYITSLPEEGNAVR